MSYLNNSLRVGCIFLQRECGSKPEAAHPQRETHSPSRPSPSSASCAQAVNIDSGPTVQLVLQACLTCIRVHLSSPRSLVVGALPRRHRNGRSHEEETEQEREEREEREGGTAERATERGGGTVRMNLAAALIVSSSIEMLADISNAMRSSFRSCLIQVSRSPTFGQLWVHVYICPLMLLV